MNWLFMRQVLFLFFIITFLVFGFQNCSKGGGDSTATFASGNSFGNVLIDMTFTGGPGLYEGSEVRIVSHLNFEKYFLQWYFQASNQTHGFPISGQNHSELVLANVELSQKGIYWLAVTDEKGKLVISNKIDVDVQPSQLKTQPKNEIVHENTQAQFVAEVRNGTEVTYAWEWMRPGKIYFEQVPEDDDIVGTLDNMLTIKTAKVKHIALYRLKITETGHDGNKDHIFYSQQVHLTLIKQQSPANKNGIAFSSEFSLNFNAIGIKRTGDNSVLLSSANDIQWERWNRNTDKFEVFKRGGEIVTGSGVTIFSASPKYTKYRAKLPTKNSGVTYSRQTAIGYTTAYVEPTVKVSTVEGWVRYNKNVGGNNKYSLRTRSTVQRATHTLDASSTTKFNYRWQRKLFNEDAYLWIYKNGSTTDFYDHTNREIFHAWNQGGGIVEHRAYIRDKWKVTKYSRPLGINNRANYTEVTIRLEVGESIVLKYNTVSHNASTGVELNETIPVQVHWQVKKGDAWQNTSSPTAVQKTINTPANAADVRQYRLRFKNTNGNSGEIITYHYFRIEKLS